jgi:hypothetical protein
MANSSVLRIVAVLVAVAFSATPTGAAHASSDAIVNSANPQGLDRTVYHPICPRLEYDQNGLFGGSASECDGQ